ncbi:RNA 2',3'-cyclic phosphodiesterase [Anaerolinea thermophila]|uniref:RNA 2',3'-cyclic phosphodiesterase n=1 Tax=Anaerolinea thermophila (strain DSM 14523 / JCM 11388 / NBRC 100420 / UNI-1) TaxID=926569 RepID=E8N387_ANATU|nr:RNA 2',3'-cyclic phosphodiesterase [Anaerolinea thermophila]BAJ62901.1 2'-5' RNA ligase [Anaerolinea thermophila UNI-1]
MNAIRAFIAIDLPEDLRHKLGEIMDSLKKKTPRAVRWVPPQNIHLTLKFLGNVSPNNLNTLTQMLRQEALRHSPMQFSVGSLGAFPSKQRPRVIWVGVHAPPALMDLQRCVDQETAVLGYPVEEREYSPHLTLGRVSQNVTALELRQIADALFDTHVGDLGVVRVTEIRLYRSDLQPGGSVYTPLFTAPLKR